MPLLDSFAMDLEGPAPEFTPVTAQARGWCVCSLATNWVHGETTTFRAPATCMVPGPPPGGLHFRARAYAMRGTTSGMVTCSTLPRVKNLAGTSTGPAFMRVSCTYVQNLETPASIRRHLHHELV